MQQAQAFSATLQKCAVVWKFRVRDWHEPFPPRWSQGRRCVLPKTQHSGCQQCTRCPCRSNGRHRVSDHRPWTIAGTCCRASWQAPVNAQAWRCGTSWNRWSLCVLLWCEAFLAHGEGGSAMRDLGRILFPQPGMLSTSTDTAPNKTATARAFHSCYYDADCQGHVMAKCPAGGLSGCSASLP